jgi:ABC-type multidrug transport system fused ATPase/permease subunit
MNFINISYLTTIRKVYKLFRHQHRKKIYTLIFLFTIAGILEVAGVGSLFPFLSILTNPETAFNNKVISEISILLNVENKKILIVIMGSITILLFLFANLLSLINIWTMQKFAWSVQSQMATDMLKDNINLPYSYFLNHHSSDITKNIITETEIFLQGCLFPLLQFAAYGLIAIFIISFLAFINLKVAIIIFSFFLFIILTFNYFIQPKLKKIGETRLKATTSRFKILNECFGAIKEIKILGREDFFLSYFKVPSSEFSQSMANFAIIKGLPRYGMEIIGFSFLIGWLIISLFNNNTFTEIFPMLGLYAIAGYRVLPAITRVYAAINAFQFHNTTIENLIIKQIQSNKNNTLLKKDNLKIIPGFKAKKLIFKNVSFSFDSSETKVLNNISLEIFKFSSIVLIGLTGAGKSTFIDLILGLISPTSGKIYHGNKLYNKSEIFNFQKCIGYVPQNIFLLDDTITSNIALGVDKKNIDIDKIYKAAKLAQIHDFINNNLEKGYNTIVGEKGIRLSGGQIQRIGIARAFYNNPDYIILDEATSNLDNTTENNFLMDLHSIKKYKTIIHVTHRANVIKAADIIFVFDKGKIKTFKNFKELKNSKYKKLTS